MHVFEDLAAQGKLLCPDTRQPLQVRQGRIVSAAGRDFGALPGPLDFLAHGQEIADVSRVRAADVERMRVQLDLAPGAGTDAEIARAIAATEARFSDSHLSAEARILASRFRMAVFELVPGNPASMLARLATIAKSLVRRRGHLKHLGNSIGDALPAGQSTCRSVRVRNVGGPLAAGTHRVETRFATLEGAALEDTVAVTPLPIDIGPAREITLILAVRVPPRTGRYRLQARLLADGEAPAAPFVKLDVEVIAGELPTFAYDYHPTALDYGADHHTAMLELVGWLGERHPRGGAALLEIGGGVHPTGHALAARGHRVVSADISHSQSILGALYFREKMPALDDSLGFISCEGTRLPFSDASFDGVMMFAAFHHFADPVALLREAGRVVRDEGFIFLGCDSCAPNPADPQYIEDLRNGINEQMWTLAEFSAFFRAAGLEVARARVDDGSLKVALLKTRAF